MNLPNYNSEVIGEVFPDAVLVLSQINVTPVSKRMYAQGTVYANQDAADAAKQPVGSVDVHVELTDAQLTGNLISVADAALAAKVANQ